LSGVCPVETPPPAPRALEPTRPQQPGMPAAEPAQATYIHIGRVELHAAPPAVTIQRTAPKPAAHQPDTGQQPGPFKGR
jgi:hypothetical protein